MFDPPTPASRPLPVLQGSDVSRTSPHTLTRFGTARSGRRRTAWSPTATTRTTAGVRRRPDGAPTPCAEDSGTRTNVDPCATSTRRPTSRALGPSGTDVHRTPPLCVLPQSTTPSLPGRGGVGGRDPRRLGKHGETLLLWGVERPGGPVSGSRPTPKSRSLSCPGTSGCREELRPGLWTG